MIIKTKNFFKKSFLLLPLTAFLVIYILIPEKTAVSKGQKRGVLFPVKTASVSVSSEAYVIPSGEAIGVKLYTDGVLVIASGSVTAEGGKSYEPAKKAGVHAGDRIIAVNGEAVPDIEALKTLVNRNGGHMTLSVMRGDNLLELPIDAVYSKDTNSFLLGLWVRDSAAGIGTLTFYNPQNSVFAALGHGICDYDTGILMKSQAGSINFCNIKGIKKSENGSPGEMLGNFSSKAEGKILLNSEAGIYGSALNIPNAAPVPVASRFETELGNAKILCDVDGGGAKAYDIEITKISTSARLSGKSFVFKITDSALIEKTGGIVQGMSGSPVIQNGKLIGAITHVFVNDASKGYGIFAENMLDMTNMVTAK